MVQQQKHVGLMVESLHGYGIRILNGISRWVYVNPGWRIALFDGERSELIELMKTWQGDGIICTLADDDFVSAAESRDIPIVNVTGRHTNHKIPSVLSDDKASGQIAAAYFLDRGFENFAFVGSSQSQFSKDRFEGFRDHLEKAGFPISSFNAPLGSEKELAKWIKSLPKPVAIYAGSDRRATSTLEACWQAKLNVPEQVTVMGTGNNQQLCELCTPTLSSVDIDMESRGYEAAALLFRIMSGDPTPSVPIRVPPIGVITRYSTDTYAYDDPELGKALRFIHKHPEKSIKVNDVVAATNISRRSLENRFRQYFSRSIHDEIWRVHFERAKLLLTTSDLGLQEIAEQSGFRTASALANLFKTKTGLTPRTYRSEHRR